ncbi:MAG: SDR family oxidoreductase [Planctomycetota bacterium]
MTLKPPRRIALTGASGGLGLEFTRQWLESGRQVCALARNPAASPGLQELARRFPDELLLVPCDVTKDASVAESRRRVEAWCPALDLFLNNAGTYGARSGTLEELDLDEMQRVFEVNTLGPLRTSRAFLPLLRKGDAPRLAHVSSLMGSISDNQMGGSYAYRMSKAALNMASSVLALELRPENIPSIVLHPGWVKTGMGGPEAPLDPPEPVAGMIGVLDRIGPADAGAFFNWKGGREPW